MAVPVEVPLDLLEGPVPSTPPAATDRVYARSGMVHFKDASGVTHALACYIQATAPINPPDRYIWIQTGLGLSGTDMTFWVEDGLP